MFVFGHISSKSHDGKSFKPQLRPARYGTVGPLRQPWWDVRRAERIRLLVGHDCRTTPSNAQAEEKSSDGVSGLVVTDVNFALF